MECFRLRRYHWIQHRIRIALCRSSLLIYHSHDRRESRSRCGRTTYWEEGIEVIRVAGLAARLIRFAHQVEISIKSIAGE
jgi:hypothetical protein